MCACAYVCAPVVSVSSWKCRDDKSENTPMCATNWNKELFSVQFKRKVVRNDYEICLLSKWRTRICISFCMNFLVAFRLSLPLRKCERLRMPTKPTINWTFDANRRSNSNRQLDVKQNVSWRAQLFFSCFDILVLWQTNSDKTSMALIIVIVVEHDLRVAIETLLLCLKCILSTFASWNMFFMSKRRNGKKNKASNENFTSQGKQKMVFVTFVWKILLKRACSLVCVCVC